MTTTHLTRETVQTVPCPECNATTGQPCQGRRGDRTANHQARVALAETGTNQRELRHYDLGTIGQPGCLGCDSTGFYPVDEDGITRWHPCPCRDNT